MGLKSLVQKSVDVAFAKAGDLATIVIFNKKSAAGYDFTTQSVNVTSEGTVVAKGIQLKKTKQAPTQTNNSTATNFLFRTSDVGNISEYSNAVIGGITYKFEPTAEINDFVTVLSFVREN